MAKKHGKATSQTSNFRYLMSNKTNRSNKKGKATNENDMESIVISTKKFVHKHERVKTSCDESSKIMVPLSAFKSNGLGQKNKQKTEQAEKKRVITCSNEEESYKMMTEI